MPPKASNLRTMPAELVARVRQAGLFRIAVPRSLGGLECDPVTVIEVIEEISRADGSAGWTVAIGNSVAFFAWLEPLVVTEMLGGDRDIVSTGVFAPMGRAVRDGGDFVLTGRWPFNSGCMHADWFQTGFFVMDGDRPAVRPDGNLDWRFAFYRREQAEIIDTWHTLGLRGTGSHDVAVHALRIPESHTAMPFYDPPRHESALLALGFSEFTAAILSGIPLGIQRSSARRAGSARAHEAPPEPGDDDRRGCARAVAGRPGGRRVAERPGVRGRRVR